MTAKKGLGRGIGALLNTDDVAEGGASVIEADINAVEPGQNQPRKSFNDESLKELADSIAAHGILQPIIVKREDGGFYSIIAGERRYRAARLAKLETVPVIVRDYSPSETLQVALIENLQREDINPVDEALTYKRLIDEFFYTQDEIAAKIGKSAASVSAAASLLKLCQPVLDMVRTGALTPTTAKALLQIKEPALQADAGQKIASERMTLAAAEKYIEGLLAGQSGAAAKKPSKSSEHFRVEQELNKILGTKVCIKPGKIKSKIEIEYYSAADLERLIDIFNGNNKV